MNIEELTIAQVKEVTQFINSGTNPAPGDESLNNMINKKVIIRTYSAGVWFGTLTEKAGTEVILSIARRLWRWHAAESISLSGVAIYGIKPDRSIITPAVENVWLEAIEIIPCTTKSINSIEGAPDAEPK